MKKIALALSFLPVVFIGCTKKEDPLPTAAQLQLMPLDQLKKINMKCREDGRNGIRTEDEKYARYCQQAYLAEGIAAGKEMTGGKK